MCLLLTRIQNVLNIKYKGGGPASPPDCLPGAPTYSWHIARENISWPKFNIFLRSISNHAIWFQSSFFKL